jgi:hypothetical protein
MTQSGLLESGSNDAVGAGSWKAAVMTQSGLAHGKRHRPSVSGQSVFTPRFESTSYQSELARRLFYTFDQSELAKRTTGHHLQDVFTTSLSAQRLYYKFDGAACM